MLLKTCNETTTFRYLSPKTNRECDEVIVPVFLFTYVAAYSMLGFFSFSRFLASVASLKWSFSGALQQTRYQVLVLIGASCAIQGISLMLADTMTLGNIAIAFVGSGITGGAIRDLLWGSAFAILFFFWMEIQMYMRKNVKNVQKLRPHMLCVILIFIAVRSTRGILEVHELNREDKGEKGGLAEDVARYTQYFLTFVCFVVGVFWSRRLQQRLKRMSVRSKAAPLNQKVTRLKFFIVVEMVAFAVYGFIGVVQRRPFVEDDFTVFFGLLCVRRLSEYFLLYYLYRVITIQSSSTSITEQVLQCATKPCTECCCKSKPRMKTATSASSASSASSMDDIEIEMIEAGNTPASEASRVPNDLKPKKTKGGVRPPPLQTTHQTHSRRFSAYVASPLNRLKHALKPLPDDGLTTISQSGSMRLSNLSELGSPSVARPTKKSPQKRIS